MNRPCAPWKRPITLTIWPAGTWMTSFHAESPGEIGTLPPYSSGLRVPPSWVSNGLPGPCG